MRAQRLLLLATPTLVALAACTAIAGLDGDFTVAGNLPDGTAPPTNEGGSTSSSSSSSASSSSSSSGSSGGPDASPDTSTADADAAPPVFDATFPPSFIPNDDCAGASRFCASFDLNTTVGSLAPWVVTQSGGDLTLAVPPGAANRAIRTESELPPGAKNVSLVWSKWGTNGTEPLIVNDGQTVDLSFAFRIERADSYAFVGGLTFDGTTYGLAVYPGACGAGVSCVQENRRSGETPDLVAASSFDPTKFHRAHVRVKKGSPSWTGSIQVGSRTISTRPDAFPANATDTVPARLEFGILRTDNNAANNVVWIDDTRLTITGP